MSNISFEEYMTWAASDVTKVFMKRIRERREYYDSALLNTNFDNLAVPAKLVGRINTLDDILEICFDDLVDPEFSDIS